jgi:hypothetical protein
MRVAEAGSWDKFGNPEEGGTSAVGSRYQATAVKTVTENGSLCDSDL